MMRLILTAILLLLLTACGSGFLPTSQLVQKAIAIQLEQTQQQLEGQLDLDFRGFEINRTKNYSGKIPHGSKLTSFSHSRNLQSRLQTTRTKVNATSKTF
jgi:hypothetical protein